MRLSTCLLRISLSMGVLVSVATAAGSDCVTVKGTSRAMTESANFPASPFAGTAALRTSAGDLQAQLATFLIGAPEMRGNVTFAPTSHCLVVSDLSGVVLGEFCTEDKAVLSETGKPGLLRLNSRLRIANGEWMGMPAAGHLTANGTMQLIPTGPAPGDPLQAITEFRMKGRICGGEE